MNCIFRRPSGVYFARLVVPARLRHVIGKTEFVASTGVREPSLAKIVGAELLASWRRRLLGAQGVPPVDVLQLSVGSPVLAGDGLLPIRDAALASGIEVNELLRAGAERDLRLYVVGASIPGFLLEEEELERDRDTGGYDVPTAKQMPLSALATSMPGTLQISLADAQAVENELRLNNACRLMILEVVGRPGTVFLPTGGLDVTIKLLSVAAREVEGIRARLASHITAEQLSQARARATPAGAGKLAGRKISEAIDPYIMERSRACSPEQARRIRAACELFVELVGDHPIADLDRQVLRRFRDEMLPCVPSNENKVRLQLGTSTVSESMNAVKGSAWSCISEGERAKRMQWVAGLFAWLVQEKWITDDPAVGLAAAVRPRKKNASHMKRDLFSGEELQQIFSAPWFKTGRGTLTRAGTYREFLPYYYWLPLLGLYTGARINELCQLGLDDVRQSGDGVWFLDINEDDDTSRKKVKNAQSRRQIPVHPHLLRQGLPQWCEALRGAGYSRLFPELPHDPVKGYSKTAVKWFSSYLARLGWSRDGRKVFHSFRHTLASYCLNTLKLSEALTAQISGHQRSKTVLGSTYRKDAPPPDVVLSVAQMDFQLPDIAPFDVEQGLAALRDALRRRRSTTEKT